MSFHSKFKSFFFSVASAYLAFMPVSFADNVFVPGALFGKISYDDHNTKTDSIHDYQQTYGREPSQQIPTSSGIFAEQEMLPAQQETMNSIKRSQAIAKEKKRRQLKQRYLNRKAFGAYSQ